MAEKDQEITGTFIDSVAWDGVEKTALSVRDGVIEYLGAELGMEPPDRTFTVFRSPATIANVASAMMNIPLTDEHVDVGSSVLSPIGSVVDAEMVDMIDEATGSKLAIRNRVKVEDVFLDELAKGKRELSLGYNARLVPHSKFDFEQRDIMPHHLAVVDAGRCGPQCRFIDHKKKEAILPKLHQAFNDAEGAPNLEQIVEIAQALPEALKKLPMDKLAEIMPMLQEIVADAGVAAAPEAAPVEEEVTDGGHEDNPKKKEEMEDAGGIGKEPPPPFSDSKEFKDAVKSATDSAVAAHTSAIVKAKDFVSEEYVFADKSTKDVMRDALAVIHGKEVFTDAELPTAFKMLKQPASDLTKFGDQGQTGKFSQLKDKEV
jgi:hypothetical protein